jgi:hypothetical protein
MHGDHGVEHGSLIRVEVTAPDEVFGQRALLLPSPRLECGDELALVDQAVLQGEQPK